MMSYLPTFGIGSSEFDAKQTKKGISAKAWGKRKVYPNTFFGSGKNSGKKLVFKKRRDDPKKIEAVHGGSLPREWERKDMIKIFNKTTKKRFPILFKQAINFHMLKSLRKI